MATIQPFLKKFLIDNFKPLFSSNELGALGNLSSTTDDLTKKIYSIDVEKHNDIEVRFDGAMLNNQNFNYIVQLSQILTNWI